MSSFELNKIFAAILVAGIVAMLAGFVAEKLVHPHVPDQHAVEIEGADLSVVGGSVKAALPDPVLHLIASADIAKGEKLSKACAACHSFDKGGPSKVGPNLWNSVGVPKAGKNFAYSDALRELGGAWSYLDLNKFLWKPKKYLPGTKMNYVGLKKPEDRAAMIAWLRTLSASPDPLPSASEIAAEAAELAPPEEAAAEVPDSENAH